MRVTRLFAGSPAPVAPLPPQVSPRSVTFSMARSVTFSMAIDSPGGGSPEQRAARCGGWGGWRGARRGGERARAGGRREQGGGGRGLGQR